MSTLKVTNIEHESTTNGGIQLDNAGHVTVDGQQLPTSGQLSNRNLIINGAMRVAQRGTSETVSDNTNEGFSTVDRWAIYFNSSMSGAVTFSQSTDAPDGFGKSAKLQCSTTNTSITGNQYMKLVHKIEGQNLQQLDYGTSNAKTTTLSWYMKTDEYTGPVSVSLEIEGGEEYYTVSVTPTNSWARYTLTIPGSTSGTIDDNNGEGLTMHFALAGSTSSSNAASSDSTAWSSTRSDYRTDIGNLLSSTSNAFYVTGVQLEVGEMATSFEHRSYSDELANCQRYYYRHADNADHNRHAIMSGGWYTDSEFYGVCHFPTTMRAVPSLKYSDGGNTAAFKVFGNASNSETDDVAIQEQGTNCFSIYFNNLGGSNAGSGGWAQLNDISDTWIAFEAEL
jgi:hypothetical protein